MKGILDRLSRRGRAAAGAQSGPDMAGDPAAAPDIGRTITGDPAAAPESGRDAEPSPEKGKSGLAGLLSRFRRQKPSGSSDGAEASDDAAGPEITPRPKTGFLSRFRRDGKSDGEEGDPGADAAKTGPGGAAPVALRYENEATVVIGERACAVGLTWLPRESGPALELVEIAQEKYAKAVGAEVAFDLVADRKGSSFIGLGSRDLGHEAGAPPLIEMIDDSALGPRWIVALRLDAEGDVYWIGSRRNGGVLEDRLVTSRAQGLDICFEYLDAPDWTSVVMPDDWRVEGSTPDLPAGTWLPKPPVRLRHTRPLRVHASKIIAGLVLLAVIAGGAWYFISENLRHQAEMRELQERIARAVNLTPQDHPWFNRTPLPAFVGACMSRIGEVMIIPPGWEVQPFTCRVNRGAGVLDMAWQRSGGATPALLYAVIGPDLPRPNLNAQMTQATASTNFDLVRNTDVPLDEPWTRQIIERRLGERFATRNVEHVIRYVADNRDPSTNALFHRHDVQVRGTGNPMEVMAFLDDLPASIPESFTFNVATSGWTLVFRIHHPPVLPEMPR